MTAAATSAFRALAAIALAVIAGHGCISATARPPDMQPSEVARASTTQAGVRLTLVVSTVAGQPRTFQFVAEAIGGADNNPELYCVGNTWDFGDGPPLSVSPSCTPWTSESKIQRRYENTHAYEKAGLYEVRFTVGAFSAHTTLTVN